MLPSTIEYLLAATDLGAQLADQSVSVLSYPYLAPASQTTVAILPPGLNYAGIVYAIEFQRALPDVFSLAVVQGGATVFNGVLTESVLVKGLSCYVVTTAQQILTANLVNRDSVNAHCIELRVYQIGASTAEQLQLMRQIVGRSTTDTSDLQLLNDILSTLKMGLNVGAAEVPPVETPVAAGVVARRSGHGRLIPIGKGIFVNS